MRLKNKQLLLCHTALAATLAVLGVESEAQVNSMVASGSYTLGTDPTVALSASYPGSNPVDVGNFLSDSTGLNSAGLHDYGSLDGNFGSRSSGYGVYQIKGGFKLVETITNTSAVAQSATFTFSITPGMLQNQVGSSLTGNQYVAAGLSFNLSANGNTVWNSSASLRTDASNGGNAQFSASGDTSLFSGSGSMYNVLGVSRSIDLGVINAGQSMQLSYELDTFANGSSTAGAPTWVPPTTFTVPDGWYVYGGCGYGYGYGGGYGGGCGVQPPGTVIDIPGYWTPGTASSSHASSGDPFSVSLGPNGEYYASVNPNPNLGSVSLSPVPEPSSLALMLGGLGLLGGIAARLRSRHEV